MGKNHCRRTYKKEQPEESIATGPLPEAEREEMSATELQPGSEPLGAHQSTSSVAACTSSVGLRNSEGLNMFVTVF